eukprot:TRINITY_DN5080_c0_g1_i6.p1 TRINITY_DN5080_c0_g1~~TRINITY_DN5080_c0_g1_i6.p1  ORF type:complete len:262 (-),score=87.00 TRINITY_DN5080_c0_g1_i6:30-815(-)
MVSLTFLYPFVPESPRFLLQHGRKEEAAAVLRRMAAKNNTEYEILNGELIGDRVDVQGPKEVFSQLLSPTYKTVTIVLWIIWVSNAFAYYGIVLVTPQYFKTRPSSEHEEWTVEQEIFITTFVTSLAEFPGLFITAYGVDKIGRKKTQAGLFGVCGVAALFLLYDKNFGFSTFTAIIARMAISGVFAATYLYTPEAYPTRIRSTGLGVCVAFSRMAALSTPYVANMFESIHVPIVLYSLTCLGAVFASMLLPAETLKQELK